MPHAPFVLSPSQHRPFFVGNTKEDKASAGWTVTDVFARRPRISAFGAGLISATGFAPLNLWPLTLACLALLIWLVANTNTFRAALTRGYLFGLGHFIIGLNWIAGAFRFQDTMPVWLGWVAVVALSIYLAVYPAAAAGLAWRIAIRSSRAQSRDTVKPNLSTALATDGLIPAFAASWIFTEWLRATLFTGFAWNPLGVALLLTPVSGLARFIGTYGLSALTVLIAGAVLHIGVPGRARWPLAGGILITGLTGWFATSAPTASTDRLIRVVQPNIGQQQKQDERFDERNFARLAALTGPPGIAPRLILWPEAAVPYFLEEERWARDRIARLMGPHDVIMTGADALVYDRAGKLVAARNSLFTMTPDAAIRARYDKSHLVPYGEYLPMRPLLSAIGLSRLVPGDLDFLPGPGPQSYALPGFGKAGVQICYEIIFSGRVIDAANRPDFLFNPSNDAWFGSWGPPQHLAQARLRAIEEGMPIIRSTPTGISAVIDPHGRLLVALPLGKAGFIQTRIPAADAPTLFARFGNAIPLDLALLLGATGVAMVRRRR